MPLTLPQVYFESPCITICFDADERLGMAVWTGHVNGQELREALLLCTHVTDHYKLTRWLADNRKMKAFTPDDQQWMADNIVPHIINSSLRRMATLVSEDEEQVAALEQLVQRAGTLPDLSLRDFTDEEEARQWLMQD
ncbi:STAS/SEC14 domain-containing protein [Rufibacter sp. LB8]|uniref:STAS/SEC14 domain-containing protein n=1 Tax=Rufibacter sp. LB8 TaxID=2777781 RepID=UPI00178C6942|nr:STAS/SEC14 domain-containing protein [Rufibacter sp. LB8]